MEVLIPKVEVHEPPGHMSSIGAVQAPPQQEVVVRVVGLRVVICSDSLWLMCWLVEFRVVFLVARSS